jgi:ubiquinone/menaquinone biosynthesis C-methylase UbiE
MLAEARPRNPNATFSLGTAEALPQTDQSADLVVTSLSFHHWADQAQGLREVARVLRPGGWFCLADHTFLPGRWVGSKVRSRQEIQDLIQGAGLAVRQVRHLRFRLVLITLAQK